MEKVVENSYDNAIQKLRGGINLKGSRSNIFLNIILFFLVAVVVALALIKKNNPVRENMIEKTDTIKTTDSVIENGETEKETGEENNNPVPEINDEDYYHVFISDYEFEVKSVRLAKECDLPQMANPREEGIELEGKRLTGDYSFVFIEVMMKNNFSVEKEVTVNNHQLKIMQETTLLDEVDIYMTDRNQDKIGKRDYYHVIMEPGQEVQITFIYIIKDSYINDKTDLILCLDPMGQDRMQYGGQNDNGYEVILDTSGKVADVVLNNLINEVNQ